MKNLSLVSVILFSYWLLATFSLLDFISGSGMSFPDWLDRILFPAYFLGFALGFGGGGLWFFIGQGISFLILLLISKVINGIFEYF